MLTLPPSIRVLLAPGATDMRKAFDGLAAAAREVLAADPLSGHLFVFCNRRRDRLKILWWDGTGFWLYAKRLERGTFAWPARGADAPGPLELRPEELTMLVSGIDLRQTARRRWYSRPA